MAGALEGVRVLDLTRMLPGPYAGMVLADLGAEVIKVEEPRGGDPTRQGTAGRGGSTAFEILNRGKQSLTLDLKTSAGVEIFRKLAASSDVVLEGFRPGVMERLGIGYDDLARLQPRLVFCSISGYGPDGPLGERAGHDINYLARAGALGLQTEGGGRPVLSPVQIADLGGALFALVAILAALAARARTGRGQRVDVAMADVSMALLPMPIAALHDGADVGLGARLPLTGALACYNVYATADGRHLSVGALEPKFWERFCRVIGRDDLAARQLDPRQEPVVAEVAAVVRARTLAEWVELFANADACVEPVLSLEEALDAPQAKHRRMILDAGARRRQLNLPFALSDTPPAIAAAAPRLGEHTRSVLRGLGYDEARIEAWLAEGVAAEAGRKPAAAP